MPDYKNTLRWVEPFGGWEADTEDTGLCNRRIIILIITLYWRKSIGRNLS